MPLRLCILNRGRRGLDNNSMEIPCSLFRRLTFFRECIFPMLTDSRNSVGRPELRLTDNLELLRNNARHERELFIQQSFNAASSFPKRIIAMDAHCWPLRMNAISAGRFQ